MSRCRSRPSVAALALLARRLRRRRAARRGTPRAARAAICAARADIVRRVAVLGDVTPELASVPQVKREVTAITSDLARDQRRRSRTWRTPTPPPCRRTRAGSRGRRGRSRAPTLSGGLAGDVRGALEPAIAQLVRGSRSAFSRRAADGAAPPRSGSGLISSAPPKKQSAPTNVPRFTSAAFTTSPDSGTVYDAIADTPNATEPDEVQPRRLPGARGRVPEDPVAHDRRAHRHDARHEEADRAERIRAPDVRPAGQRGERADVEEERARELDRRRPPVAPGGAAPGAPPAPPGEQPLRERRRREAQRARGSTSRCPPSRRRATRTPGRPRSRSTASRPRRAGPPSAVRRAGSGRPGVGGNGRLRLGVVPPHRGRATIWTAADTSGAVRISPTIPNRAPPPMVAIRTTSGFRLSVAPNAIGCTICWRMPFARSAVTAMITASL